MGAARRVEVRATKLYPHEISLSLPNAQISRFVGGIVAPLAQAQAQADRSLLSTKQRREQGGDGGDAEERAGAMPKLHTARHEFLLIVVL